MEYTDRHKLFPNKVIISYPFSWGGQLKDRWMWLAEFNGEVLDYDSRDGLIKDAKKDGLDYVVLRVHKNFSIDVVESSKPLANKKDVPCQTK
jgi:hypothetical protein